jgi:hypothetical protein
VPPLRRDYEGQDVRCVWGTGADLGANATTFPSIFLDSYFWTTAVDACLEIQITDCEAYVGG